MSEALLDIADIHTYYGSIRALKGVSLTVGRGEIVTLIGSNGAGKTTTLKTVIGNVRPLRGPSPSTASASTRCPRTGSCGSGSRSRRRAAGSSPGCPSSRTSSSARSPGRIGRRFREDLERVLGLFPRLRERLQQKGGTLSGGEQQMLAMGRALMARPTVLLLDEPSMGLSPILVETIFGIIRDINAQGTTILLVEQNARMALRVAHRGYVIQTGRIVLSDTGKELLRSDVVRKAYLGEK